MDIQMFIEFETYLEIKNIPHEINLNLNANNP
jgi:hypothetical protein